MRRAGADAVVIGRLAPLAVLAQSAFLVGMAALLLWIAFVHGYYRPNREGLQYGVGYFLTPLLGLAILAYCGAPTLFRLVFNRGIGVWVENDELHFGGDPIPLQDIEAVVIGPEGMFYGVPDGLDFELRTGKRRGVPSFGLSTPVAEMVTALAALGLVVRPHAKGAANESADGAGDPG